jgi:hypothetical protein
MSQILPKEGLRFALHWWCAQASNPFMARE